MTKTIKSQTKIDGYYFITVDDESGQCVDCTCPDHYYRGRTCKHMREFNTEVRKAEVFNALRKQYDSRLNGQEQTQYLNYLLSIGA